MTPLGETALHVALECGAVLHVVDFIVQNTGGEGGGLNTQTREGNTALHYCVIHARVEALRWDSY